MSLLEINFLETANLIGARLCRDALRDGKRANWMGDSRETVGNSWAVAYRALGGDLYNGTCGVALFLARLHQLTGEKLYRSTAEAGIAHSLSRLDDIPSSSRTSFYVGLTGIAYALFEVGEIFAAGEFKKRAFEILRSIAAEKDLSGQGIDVVGGSAGTIPALLNIHRRDPQDFLLEAAIRHGQRLLDAAARTDAGWSWNTLGTPVEYNLTGFSHGTAGIGWALTELFNVTKDKDFLTAAEQAINYERLHFNPQYENWADFRGLYDQTAGVAAGITYPVAWCHGAAGIGLSRLRLFELLKEQSYRDEAEIAIRTTAKMFTQSNDLIKADFSPCHGAAGNAELMIYASEVFGGADYQSLAAQVGQIGIEIFQKNNAPWSCGVMGGGETPGLMLGLAGIGYFYLRLYDAARVPSINMVF